MRSWIRTPRVLDGAGETADQVGRLHRGAVRREGTAEHVGRRQVRGRFTGIEQSQVVLVQAARACFGHLGTRSFELRSAARQGDGPTALEPGVDALAVADPTDLADGVAHRAVQPKCIRRARGGDELGPRRREQRAAPTTVAPRRSESDVLSLEHDDPQGRISAAEVVRRPQAGEPGTDDHDVVRRGARQRAPLRQRFAGGVRPQAGALLGAQRTPQE
ncbi:hypothetical protein ABIE44_000604 [Marmoricola sp. OAE513]